MDHDSWRSMAGFMSLNISVGLVWLVAAVYFQSGYELTEEWAKHVDGRMRIQHKIAI